jgi:putative transcriptional regulator
MKIEFELERHLERQGHTRYWLSKQTGIAYNTLTRLNKGRAKGVEFDTLAKICEALKLEPGDVLKLVESENHGRKLTTKK